METNPDKAKEIAAAFSERSLKFPELQDSLQKLDMESF